MSLIFVRWIQMITHITLNWQTDQIFRQDLVAYRLSNCIVAHLREWKPIFTHARKQIATRK